MICDYVIAFRTKDSAIAACDTPLMLIRAKVIIVLLIHLRFDQEQCVRRGQGTVPRDVRHGSHAVSSRDLTRYPNNRLFLRGLELTLSGRHTTKSSNRQNHIAHRKRNSEKLASNIRNAYKSLKRKDNEIQIRTFYSNYRSWHRNRSYRIIRNCCEKVGTILNQMASLSKVLEVNGERAIIDSTN